MFFQRLSHLISVYQHQTRVWTWFATWYIFSTKKILSFF